jgi:hypothetical protein
VTVDARLFAYALEPQLQRLRWRLDESLARLAAAARELAQRRDECDALDSQIATAARPTETDRIDPGHARNALEFIAALRRRRALAGNALANAQVEEQSRRDATTAIRLEIDKLESDREARLAEHLVERQRLAARDADQDWTARSHWRVADRARTGS